MLPVIEAQGAMAMGKLQVIPARCRLESREPGPLAAAPTPEERRKGQIEPMEHRIFAFAINRGHAAIDAICRRAQRRDLSVLVLGRHADSTQAIGVAPLLQ
jgi:hypothetical protein